MLQDPYISLKTEQQAERQEGLPLQEGIYGWFPAYERKSQDRQKCKLCALDEDVHTRAWTAYGPEKNQQAALRVLRRAGLGGVEAKTVANHFQAHHYNQPPAPLVAAKKAAEALRSIPDRHGRTRKIIKTIARQRALSFQQIVQLFCEPDAKSELAASKIASRLISRMRFSHLLYPLRSEGKKSAETYYTLAGWSESLAEEMGEKAQVQSHRDQTPLYQVEHDSRAADVFVQLRRQLYPRSQKGRIVELFGKKVPMHMSTESWWGSRDLLCSSPDGLVRVQLDGFATLEVNDGRKQQFQLPFFFEWDSGLHDWKKVVQGVVDYSILANQGILQERFPQIQATDYLPPLLVVCPSQHRLEKIQTSLQEKLGEMEMHPMVLLITQADLQDDAWMSGRWSMVGFQADEFNLAELLLTASRALNNKQPIHWRHRIRINRAGAEIPPPRYPNWLVC